MLRREGAMSGIDIIRSSKFSEYPRLVFGHSTRIGGVSREPYVLNLSFNVGDDSSRVWENRRLFFGELNIPLDQLAIPKQRHTNVVRVASEPGDYEMCDALLTDARDVYLVVSVADCIPLFVFDPVKNVIGAIHVGWRGGASGIVNEALRVFVEEFSSGPEDLVVYIGPSARACCYEVGGEVASKFPEEYTKAKPDGKFFLDLPGFSRRQLMEFGVKEERIEENGKCTICTPGLFHSYRRGGGRSGRMMGVIGLHGQKSADR
jgi:YfiH family protein